MTGFILFLGVEVELFSACFGDKPSWDPCKFECLDEESSVEAVEAALARPGLRCVVIQDIGGSPWWNTVKNYYNNGGLVVYFGIYGEFNAPDLLSQEFGLQWRFSAYTRHEFVLTPVGRELFGDTVTEQKYSKCNLLQVPEEDRIMVPKSMSLEEFMKDECDSDDEDTEGKYANYHSRMDAQVPLAMHTADHGGKVAYLGFVNGDGNIPKFVRALCTNTKVQK